MTSILKKDNFAPTNSKAVLSDDNILLVVFGGATVNLEENDREGQWAKTTFEDVKRNFSDRKVSILIDETRVDSVEFNSDDAIDIYKAILKDPYVIRVALFGAPTTWGFMIELFRFYSKKVKAFRDEEEARAWLAKGVY